MVEFMLIFGIYYVICIVGDLQENFDFWVEMFGFCFVKCFINQDDFSMYYFFFMDVVGMFGMSMMFFLWENFLCGKVGIGQVFWIVFCVFEGSFDYWED